VSRVWLRENPPWEWPWVVPCSARQNETINKSQKFRAYIKKCISSSRYTDKFLRFFTCLVRDGTRSEICDALGWLHK
jgi:hypothetical protein